MIVKVTISKRLTASCTECEHIKKTSFSDDAYGATKTFYDYECAIEDINDCPEAVDCIECLEIPKGWDYETSSVEEE